MAVVLHREDSESSQASTLPVERRNASHIVVRNHPIQPPPTRPGTKITARSDVHYARAEPNREDVFKGTYKRRSVQLNQCGFHGVNTRPYKDLGPVELNDGRLILEGLGQSTSQEQIGDGLSEDSDLSPRQPLPPDHNLTSPYKIKLRSKTPSQFPSNLANLRQAVDEGDDRLEVIRRGKGLFELIKKHDAEKHNEEVELIKLKKEEGKNEWKEAEVMSHVSLTEDQEELIKKQTTQLQTKIDVEDLSEGPQQQSVDESRDHYRLLDDEESLCSHPNSAVGESWNMVRPDRSMDLQFSYLHGSIDRRFVSGSESPQQQQHSSDVNEEIERWYRILCVLVWILEAMRMDSPHHMTPFHKCWNRDRPLPDEVTGKRTHDMNRSLLNRWEKLRRDQKAQALFNFRSKVQASIFIQRASPSRQGSPIKKKPVIAQALLEVPNQPVNGELPKTHPKPGVSNGGGRISRLKEEEEKMKKQKKLTPSQMGNLITLLEEELNYSKKQSRNRIKAMIKQADEARLKSIHVKKKKAWQLPPLPRLDVGAVEREFEESEERRRMIAHEQLTAMERDRSKALHQRFSSLKVSGNLWEDLSVMREGVQIETTSMARRKLLMNYEWFPELKSMIPDCVQQTPKCSKLLAILEDMAAYMCEVGPKRMSRRRLIQVLATRKPYELRNPDIADAVEFLTQRVIYVVAEDCSKWLEQHTLAFQRTLSAKSGKISR